VARRSALRRGLEHAVPRVADGRTGTTLLGTMIALLAERGGARLKRPLNALALLR